MLGPTELIIILVIVIVLFGAKKLPELARGLGQGVREFRDSTQEPARPAVQEPVRPVTPPVQASAAPERAVAVQVNVNPGTPVTVSPVTVSPAESERAEPVVTEGRKS